VEYDDVPANGELLALPSGVGWPVMKILMVIAGVVLVVAAQDLPLPVRE
jgi:hypothetical protein